MPSRSGGEQGSQSRRAVLATGLSGAAVLLAGCGGGFNIGDTFNREPPPPARPPGEPGLPSAATTLPPPGPAEGAPVGSGHVKIALLLPMSAAGNAGAAGQSMRNAADMALNEFNNPNVQLLVKDDAGTAQGAQQAAQQAVDDGAEILLGPLFASSVGVVGQVARARNIPVIAFSTDSNVAARGVYLLSFLPESDVDRIVEYAISQGKRSFVALLPDNAYGSVAEAAFKQAVSRKGGRVMALERYPTDEKGMQESVSLISQAAGRADALFVPDSGDAVARVAQALTQGGVDLKRLQVIGTGLWDDPRVFSAPALDGGWYAAPDSAGFRAFATRYRGRYNQEPVRTATLAYDAVALVAALVKTQGGRISDEVLTNASGFAGIDGVFRFRPDGTNQRGLAVLKVTPSGGQVIAPPPKNFAA